MATPLYKYLRKSGTTKYVFPGAQEDINASQQNPNYKITFDKVVYLNIPRQDLSKGILDFENTFSQNPSSQSASSKPSYKGFGDDIIESLRNYVANHDTTIRETRINQKEYFYDNNILKTTSEKIFWKWCKKLKIIEFEPAIKVEDYFNNLDEFENKNGPNGNLDYFKEYLWKEREVLNLKILSIDYLNDGSLITFTSKHNYKIGDFITLKGTNNIDLDNLQHEILEVLTDTPLLQNTIKISTVSLESGTTFTSPLPSSILMYNELIKYIGEVQSVQNIQSANRNYTQALTFLPEHEGSTPTKLFRLHSDKNYRPGLIYPILPIQKQSEIVGAENFNNPIITNTEKYPGDQYGHFDSPDYTYRTVSGDNLRRSGKYYGIKNGSFNSEPEFDGSNIDGINIDFDPSHYSKMNIPGLETENFNEFNSLRINDESPEDFEFNAILWYYSVEDTTVENGIVDMNLYGIEILENPNNEQVPNIDNTYKPRIPVYKKLISNEEQDGTSFQFSLNIDILIDNDNLETKYDPSQIYDLYSFNLYNEAMRRYAETNDNFLNIISEFKDIRDEHSKLLSLVYSQTSINIINNRLFNLEKLLQLYSTLQIGESDSIIPSIDNSVSPPKVRLKSVDSLYSTIFNKNTSEMFNASTNTIIEYKIPNIKNKNYSVVLNNNDQNYTINPLPSNLKVLINSDLDFKQQLDIFLISNNAILNKKVDVYINYLNSSTNSISEELLISNIDLPVDLYPMNLNKNRSQTWKTFNSVKPIDIILQNISNDLYIDLIFDRKLFFNVDDEIVLNNFILNTTTLSINSFNNLEESDLSGQRKIKSVNLNTNTIRIEVTGNINITNLESIIGSGVSIFDRLIGSADLTLNTGKKISILRINDSDNSLIENRYLIQNSKL